MYVAGAPHPGRTKQVSVGLMTKWERAVRRLERLGLATVGVAAGDCGGTALDLLLATDVRIAVAGARLIVPVTGDATWPGMALYRLARQGSAAGLRRAALLGYAKTDHVARVTLDRPEVLNAMDLRMHEELAEVWDDIEADDEIRVVVLTGAGDRAFSVGQDLVERARRDDAGAPPSSFGSRGSPSGSNSANR